MLGVAAGEVNYLYRLYSAHGEMLDLPCHVKLRHQAAGSEALPAVGDWNARPRGSQGSPRTTIHGRDSPTANHCFSR